MSREPRRFPRPSFPCHADPIPHDENARRREFSVGFWYIDTSDGFRPVRLLLERKRQFGQPSLDAILFDVRKDLSIHARRTLIGATLGVGVGQNVIAADLVVQRLEAITGFCLRFRVQRLLQFLDAFRS
jgi:hypothetical protein